ncbi:MAG: hypothetical protein HZB26_08775 [Candidatus Hydrogenedentes bacterium]|nr:hypothetical protein [Candidatus Hydrogenedentota bacterium]
MPKRLSVFSLMVLSVASVHAAPEKGTVDVGVQPMHPASALLLGQNLETALDTVPGMLTDRLDNPKFLGPPDSVTGIAPGWRHNSDNMNEVRCELTPGAGMSGNAAQLIQNFNAKYAFGILQNNRQVRAGEKLEVELWARAWNTPATLKVGLLPLPSSLPPYSEATLEIKTSYYERYTAVLTCPADDNKAAFYCTLQGLGAVWVDQIHLRPVGEGNVSPDVVKRFAELRIPVLRFPGGVATTVYHWRLGTGPLELRPTLPDPAFKNRMFYDFGTDEFLQLCLDQKIVPHITVNIGFGTPQEAADWARYCADWYRKHNAEPPPAYFQIGNHPYLGAELAHMTPEMYVQALKAYVPGVREAYPGARILAVCDPYDGNWQNTLLDQGAGLFDVIALQAYASQPPEMGGAADAKAVDPKGGEVRMAALSEGAEGLGAVIHKTAEAARKRGLPAKVSFVEWNLWGHASHRDGKNFYEPYDVQHALFVSIMLHQFMRLAPEMEAGYFYHLLNPMGMYIHRGPEVSESCMVDVFKLYRPALPGDILPVTVTGPTLGGRPAVDAVAVRNAEGTWIYCVNLHPSAAAEMELTGLKPNGSEVVTMSGAAPDGQFTRAVKTLTGGPLSLPPLSLVRVHVKAP